MELEGLFRRAVRKGGSGAGNNFGCGVDMCAPVIRVVLLGRTPAVLGLKPSVRMVCWPVGLLVVVLPIFFPEGAGGMSGSAALGTTKEGVGEGIKVLLRGRALGTEGGNLERGSGVKSGSSEDSRLGSGGRDMTVNEGAGWRCLIGMGAIGLGLSIPW